MQIFLGQGGRGRSYRRSILDEYFDGAKERIECLRPEEARDLGRASGRAVKLAGRHEQ